MPTEFQLPLHKRLGYRAVRWTSRMMGVATLRLRCHHRWRLDELDGALVCANHQSYLDPILIGCTFDRKVNYLARETLFRFPLGPVIRFLDAIPLNRDGLGLAGMKETLKRLRRGEPVLVFPEGTRSRDGALQPMMPGVCSLARRGRVPILPVGIAGAFESWPRQRLMPLPSVVDVVVGEPISQEWYQQRDDEQLLCELSARIDVCHRDAVHRVKHRAGV
ncbi:MAG: 1-acyl-sn-glycerol-3-phosphate acyltransferase [Planctomycetales bacterium]|nr:1-acyl-sn-glycerol-3-phosphate acyltransferase [Planctomycetales bacterium]